MASKHYWHCHHLWVLRSLWKHGLSFGIVDTSLIGRRKNAIVWCVILTTGVKSFLKIVFLTLLSAFIQELLGLEKNKISCLLVDGHLVVKFWTKILTYLIGSPSYNFQQVLLHCGLLNSMSQSWTTEKKLKFISYNIFTVETLPLLALLVF